MRATVSGLVTGVTTNVYKDTEYTRVVLLPEGDTYPVRLQCKSDDWPAGVEAPAVGAHASFEVKVYANKSANGDPYLSAQIKG